jgi:hypothetical protein
MWSPIRSVVSGRLIAAAAVLAALAAPAPAQGFNVDLGIHYGVPSEAYAAAAGRAGPWNEAELGVNTLVDVGGWPSGASLDVAATSYGAAAPGSGGDDELLLNDNVYSSGGSWSADFSGLEPGDYFVYLYAPTNAVVPTGALTVQGASYAGLPGDPGGTLIEGVSWMYARVSTADGTLAIAGSAAAYSGLAGIQLVPVPKTAVNVDFSLLFTAPSDTYGAASPQVGAWNQVGAGVTPLDRPDGFPSGATVTVVSEYTHGSAGTHVTDDELLLNDNFYSNTPWSADLGGLVPGDYTVYLYAPGNTSVASGDMTVGGIPVASLPGDPDAQLVEGVSWVRVVVSVTGDTLPISGDGPGPCGLAGLQLVPTWSGAVNVDFGYPLVSYLPSPDYGAASVQAGTWNRVGKGSTALVDLAGEWTGISAFVNADYEGGTASIPVGDDQFLLGDWFYDSTHWSTTLTGIPPDAYVLYVYAPSHPGIATGDMIVSASGTATVIGSLPGDAGWTLVEGTSWARALVTVDDGSLEIASTLASGNRGLAGLQLVPQAGQSFCTAGVSASGCQATLAAVGVPSATAGEGFELVAAGVEGAKDGLFFFGANGRQANPWGNGSSYQCVVPPVKRAGLLLGIGTVQGCDGTFGQDLNALWCPTCPKPNHNPGAGAVVQAQLWYRDPWNTSNQTTSLSNAIEFSVQP